MERSELGECRRMLRNTEEIGKAKTKTVRKDTVRRTD